MLAATVGDTLLSQGMKQVGAVPTAGLVAIRRSVRLVATNGRVLAGVLLLIVHFALFLASLSWADVSLVVPATAATYVTTALLSRACLDERISAVRWAGILLITVGVVLVAVG